MQQPAMPATVVATHLAASASSLAAAMSPESLATTGELADVLDQIVAGQRDLAVALGRLADRLTGADLDPLTEVLLAASAAAGHSADALAASTPLVDSLLDSAGDVHL